MSKKDKKRIKELEKTTSNLIRMHVNLRDNYIQRCIEQDKLTAFQAGTIPSEKEQEKAEQPQQSEAKKERELMGKVNAELAKFASLEVFNADRKNFFLPPIGKLEFDKMKAAIECTIAIAKMVRPDYFDQIDQIKIPQTEQDKPEQSQPENHRENLGEPVLNKPEQFKKGQFDAEKLDASLSKLASLPLKSEQELAEAKRTNRINAALKLLVDDLAKHLNFTLENFGKDRAKQIEMLQIYCDNFKEDLADFRRKVLSVSKMVEAKQDNPKKDTPPPPELERGKVWIIQTNPKKEERLNAFYLEKVSTDGIVIYTPEQGKARKFGCFGEAWDLARRLEKASKGRYKYDYFKIVPMDTKQTETEQKEAEESEPTLPAPEQKEADKSGSELGGTDGADSPKEVESWVIEIRKKATREKVGYVWKGSKKTMIVWQNLCDAKRFRSKQSAIDFFAEKFVMTDAILFHTIVKI